MELDDWATVAEDPDEAPEVSIKSEDVEALELAEEAREAASALWGDLEEAVGIWPWRPATRIMLSRLSRLITSYN